MMLICKKWVHPTTIQIRGFLPQEWVNILHGVVTSTQTLDLLHMALMASRTT